MSITGIVKITVQFWGDYGNNTAKISKNCSQLASNSIPFLDQVANALSKGKIITLYNDGSDVLGTFLSTLSVVQLRDYEGISFGVSGIALGTLDLFDTATSVIQQFFTISAENPIINHGLPLGMVLASASAVVKAIKTYQVSNFHNDFKNFKENPINLNAYLQEKLGVTDEELQKLEEACTLTDEERRAWIDKEITKIKALKKEALKRRSNKDVANSLESLIKLAERDRPLSELESQELIRLLGDIDTALGRNLSLKEASLLAGVLIAAALMLFTAPVAIVIPISLLTAAFSIKIAIQVYKDYYKKEGLDLEFHGQVEQTRQMFERLLKS